MTEDKVVSLHGEAVPQPGQPMPTVVKILEDLLEAARSGEVVAIAAAYSYRDFTSSYRATGRFRPYGLIGAIEIMKADIVRDELE